MSLLKPHPPPRPPQSRAVGTGRNPTKVGGAAFEELLKEIAANAAEGTTRSRSNSRSRAVVPQAPNTARAPSASRAHGAIAALAEITQRELNAKKPTAAPLSARANLCPATINDTPTSTAGSSTLCTPRGATGGFTWQEIISKHASHITAYEAREIQQYETVYYCGHKCNRKVHGTDLAGTNNHAYDDAQGDYRVMQDDHMDYRYQLLEPLGRGSFGQVSKALDHKTQQIVALKIIKNKKKFHEQAAIEVKVLKHLNAKDPEGHANVVRMISSFKFRNHMVIAFELHGQSLYDLHKAHRFAPMTEGAVRTFAKQMLQTLVLTHREHVVHCDLKPENVLLAAGSKTRVKVIDFGSACFDSERLYTYIQSRFYRAPEILLGIPYTSQIDVWSLGCMLAEFSNGYPLFAGESEIQQMLLIMETFGVPPRSMLDRAPRKRVFFDATNTPKLVPNSRGKTPRPGTKSLSSFVQTTNADFIDLLRGMLTYEPERRLTPSEALRHPFFGEPVPASDGHGVVLPRLQPSTARR